MSNQDKTFLFLSPEVDHFLSENDINIQELLRQSGYKIDVQFGEDPAPSFRGEKEPVTLLRNCSAAMWKAG